MSYNVVVVDDDEIILLLHNKIIQELAHDSPKTFNSAHKALTFSIAFLMMGNPFCCFWTLTCLLWMAGDY
jgi:hypothetical protein